MYFKSALTNTFPEKQNKTHGCDIWIMWQTKMRSEAQ